MLSTYDDLDVGLLQALQTRRAKCCVFSVVPFRNQPRAASASSSPARDSPRQPSHLMHTSDEEGILGRVGRIARSRPGHPAIAIVAVPPVFPG